MRKPIILPLRTALHEVAINIDTRDPLDIAPDMADCERTQHADSWRGYLEPPESLDDRGAGTRAAHPKGEA